VNLAADANVLLSAVIGGRARLVFSSTEVDEILTTETVFAEVEEYAAILGRKKKLNPEALMLAVASLPVSIVARDVYARSMAEARRQIGARDPDDVELLALALQYKISVWSNDNDFEGCGAEWFTTAEMLRKLGISEGESGD
jgi:predicted nucleic acid-binding protein